MSVALYPRRKRRNGCGGRAAGSANLAASEFCDRFGTTGAYQCNSEGRAAYDAAQKIEDVSERRRAVALASRDMRYFADRLRTAQLVTPSADFSAVAFGHRVTFRRGDGRRQAFRIVGEDEADPLMDQYRTSLPLRGL
jgi:transcription elongation GreA/GreB family factor